MALPDKRITKVKTDGSNTYDIVAQYMTDGSSNYALTAPTLTQDETIALTSQIVPLCVSKTYSELKTMRDGGTLVPGQWYRLTDYACTTTTSNTSSASHPFDILVRADATNKLNETCYAALHSGNTYFNSCKLEAWQL